MDERTDSPRMRTAVPIIPARDVATLARWYEERLGFAVLHLESEYGVLERDAVQVHLWGPSAIEPEDSQTMFRIGVDGIDALHAHCSEHGIVHPRAPLERRPWGRREFSVIDGDGNLLTFFGHRQ